jgi:hypothetical protein
MYRHKVGKRISTWILTWLGSFLLYKTLSKQLVLRSKSRKEPSASTAYEKPKSRTKTDVMAVWQEQEREQRENRQE